MRKSAMPFVNEKHEKILYGYLSFIDKSLSKAQNLIRGTWPLAYHCSHLIIVAQDHG